MRLVTFAEREAEDVRMLCRQAQLATGDCVIDVGCGPLGALSTLSDVVGPTGAVIGIDSSPQALATASQLLRQLSLRNVRLVHADITAFDCDAAALRHTAHLAYCRLVLSHQRDPQAWLRRVLQLVRPGGHVAYQDVLHGVGPRCEPAVPAQDEAWRLILDLFARRGLATAVGFDHAILARACDCEVIHQRGKFAVLPASQGFTIVQQLLTASRAALSEVGTSEPARTDALIESLEHAKLGSYRYWHGPLSVETLVRTPLQPA